jgi:hypothetical protein
MNKEEALELVRGYLYDYFPSEQSDRVEEICNALADKPKWIPIKNLADPGQELLEAYNKYGSKMLLVTWYDPNFDVYDVDTVYYDMTEWSDDITNVIAYREYIEPEPYKFYVE